MLHTRDSSVGKATTLTGGIVGISVLAEQLNGHGNLYYFGGYIPKTLSKN